MYTYTIYCFNGSQFTIEADSQEQAITALNREYGYTSQDVKAVRKEI